MKKIECDFYSIDIVMIIKTYLLHKNIYGN